MDTVNKLTHKLTKFTTCQTTECLFRLFTHPGKRLLIIKSLFLSFKLYIYEVRHRRNLTFNDSIKNLSNVSNIEKTTSKSDLKKWKVTGNITR